MERGEVRPGQEKQTQAERVAARPVFEVGATAEAERPEKFFDAAARADRGDFAATDPEHGTAVLVAGGPEAPEEFVQALGKTASVEFARRIIRNQVDTKPLRSRDIEKDPVPLRELAAAHASLGPYTDTRDMQRHELLRKAAHQLQLGEQESFHEREIPIVWAKVITEKTGERLVAATTGGKEISIFIVDRERGEIKDLAENVAGQPLMEKNQMTGEELTLEGVKREVVSHELATGDLVIMAPTRDVDVDALKKFIALNRYDAPEKLSEKLRAQAGITTNVVLRARA